MKRKKDKVYNETVDYIVSTIDYDLEEGYFDYICYCDASVKDVMDAMELIIQKRWFGAKPLYARKVLCVDELHSHAGNDCSMAIMFATNPEDFDTNESQNYSYVIEKFPTICGYSEKNGNYNITASVKIFEDGNYYSYEEWRNKHHMNLEKGDPVVICKNSYSPAFEKTMNTAYYTGEQKTDENTGETLWQLADRMDLDAYRGDDNRIGRSNFYCKHGIDVDSFYSLDEEEKYFLSFPEYHFQLECFAEAAKKAHVLLENRMGTVKN